LSHDATTPRRHDATTPRRHDATTPRRHDATTPRRHDATTRVEIRPALLGPSLGKSIGRCAGPLDFEICATPA
jgi:hypothetical protein